jgi:hypothetical protein
MKNNVYASIFACFLYRDCTESTKRYLEFYLTEKITKLSLDNSVTLLKVVKGLLSFSLMNERKRTKNGIRRQMNISKKPTIQRLPDIAQQQI